MGDFHQVWGWIAVAVSGIAGLFLIITHWSRATFGRLQWIAIGIAVSALVLQVALGLAAMNLEDSDPGNQHVFYGVVISFTLAFAYIYRAQLAKKPGLYYGLLMLFLMGLGIRGILAFGGNF